MEYLFQFFKDKDLQYVLPMPIYRLHLVLSLANVESLPANIQTSITMSSRDLKVAHALFKSTTEANKLSRAIMLSYNILNQQFHCMMRTN